MDMNCISLLYESVCIFGGMNISRTQVVNCKARKHYTFLCSRSLIMRQRTCAITDEHAKNGHPQNLLHLFTIVQIIWFYVSLK